MPKKQRIISIDTELHRRLLELSGSMEIPLANLLKIAGRISLKTIKPEEFNNKARIIYYSSHPIPRQTINYKVQRFLQLAEDYFS